ncbi:MAG: hypothetical protein DME60_14035 [Verrucomicrobia bacterium]|nr:MAG: hypothetical protein DME60_14035 [Verrucomicrobiota bacterium]
MAAVYGRFFGNAMRAARFRPRNSRMKSLIPATIRPRRWEGRGHPPSLRILRQFRCFARNHVICWWQNAERWSKANDSPSAYLVLECGDMLPL